MTDQDNLPGWAEEIATLLPACAHLLVSGNIRDEYLVGNGMIGFVEVCRAVLERQGIDLLITYDITTGPRIATPGGDAGERVAEALDDDVDDLAQDHDIDGLAKLVERVSGADVPIGLVVLSASRLILEHDRPTIEELAAFRRIDRLAHEARPGPANERFNPIVWALDSEQDVPTWFAIGNEKLRSIVVPRPDSGDRMAVARKLVERLPTRADTSALTDAARIALAERAAQVLAQQTAGLTLVAMESIVSVAEDQGWPQEQLEDAARAYRIGIIDNPWHNEYLPERLNNEITQLAAVVADPEAKPADGEPEGIVHRVLGQTTAVQRALEIVVRSVVSLTAAHTTSTSRPRGVLFLAGPTGVGKTELAKALTKLLFDDDQMYIRFDMSEFAAEHSADRFVGAPPGYTGYERGGELTNAVRKQPFSVVLFDEIEKAHPQVLDKFLQLLDDGRLTDGRGETAWFTETLVVFTSNLGIHDMVFEETENGGRSARWVKVVTSEDEPEEVVEKVKQGVERHFELHMRRPELLNRIGRDNIVVFDFIRYDTGSRICAQMIDNVLERVREEHRLDVVLSQRAEATIWSECLAPDTLDMGGRGISATLETVLVNPLAMAIFRHLPLSGRLQVLDLSKPDGVTWWAETDRDAHAARPAIMADVVSASRAEP